MAKQHFGLLEAALRRIVHEEMYDAMVRLAGLEKVTQELFKIVKDGAQFALAETELELRKAKSTKLRQHLMKRKPRKRRRSRL